MPGVVAVVAYDLFLVLFTSVQGNGFFATLLDLVSTLFCLLTFAKSAQMFKEKPFCLITFDEKKHTGLVSSLMKRSF